LAKNPERQHLFTPRIIELSDLGPRVGLAASHKTRKVTWMVWCGSCKRARSTKRAPMGCMRGDGGYQGAVVLDGTLHVGHWQQVGVAAANVANCLGRIRWQLTCALALEKILLNLVSFTICILIKCQFSYSILFE